MMKKLTMCASILTLALGLNQKVYSSENCGPHFFSESEQQVLQNIDVANNLDAFIDEINTNNRELLRQKDITWNAYLFKGDYVLLCETRKLLHKSYTIYEILDIYNNCKKLYMPDIVSLESLLASALEGQEEFEKLSDVIGNAFIELHKGKNTASKEAENKVPDLIRIAEQAIKKAGRIIGHTKKLTGYFDQSLSEIVEKIEHYTNEIQLIIDSLNYNYFHGDQLVVFNDATELAQNLKNIYQHIERMKALFLPDLPKRRDKNLFKTIDNAIEELNKNESPTLNQAEHIAYPIITDAETMSEILSRYINTMRSLINYSHQSNQ